MTPRSILLSLLILSPAACGPAPSNASTTGPTGTPATSTTPPADVPDPCTLLTAAQASTLGASPGLTSATTGANGFKKGCAWKNALGDAVVNLYISTLPGGVDLASVQQSWLRNEEGTAVTVGDGAKVYLTAPSRIVVVSGWYDFRLEAYNGDPGVSQLLQDAAKQVIAALPK